MANHDGRNHPSRRTPYNFFVAMPDDWLLDGDSEEAAAALRDRFREAMRTPLITLDTSAMDASLAALRTPLITLHEMDPYADTRPLRVMYAFEKRVVTWTSWTFGFWWGTVGNTEKRALEIGPLQYVWTATFTREPKWLRRALRRLVG